MGTHSGYPLEISVQDRFYCLLLKPDYSKSAAAAQWYKVSNDMYSV